MIRVSISIKFCIKQTSYKLDVVFRNPGTDGTRNVINVSTPSHSGVLYKVQTVAQLRDCYVLVGAAQIEIQYTYGHYMYIREAILNPNSSTLEPDRPQHIGPTACIIAQQYSSTTFVSLCFVHPRKKVGVSFNNFIISFFYFFLNCVGMKLRNMTLCYVRECL